MTWNNDTRQYILPAKHDAPYSRVCPLPPYLISGAFDSLRSSSLELHVPISGDAIQVDPLRANHACDVAMLQVYIKKDKEEGSVAVRLSHVAAFSITYIDETEAPTPVISTAVSSIHFSRSVSEVWSVDFPNAEDNPPEILSQIGLRTFMNLVIGHAAERQGYSPVTDKETSLDETSTNPSGYLPD